MKPSVIVWDLETVPDLGGFAAANDLVGKSDVEVREAIGDKFSKQGIVSDPYRRAARDVTWAATTSSIIDKSISVGGET
jgi:hypothetical protein